MFRLLSSGVLSLGLGAVAFGTHLCAGELRYMRIEGLTYRIEVRLYHSSGQPSDVPEMILSYGDGSVDTIATQNEMALAGNCCDRLRTYVGQHTFSGPGLYTPSVIARNRLAGVVNVPASVDTPICLSAMLLVSPDLTNSSPEFTNHAGFSYYNGDVLAHELQPYDADGDSLSFELAEPMGDECDPIPGYQFPDEVVPGPYSMAVSSSGVLEWNAPQLAGFYAVAVRCMEWRDGVMIGAVTRDMMLCVSTMLTAVPDVNGLSMAMIQPSSAGPVAVQTTDWSPSSIDIFDPSGALIEHIRPTTMRTIFATDEMVPGIYLVKVTGAAGESCTGRFVVAR